MPLGHTNLSYYKAKNSTDRDGRSQEGTSRGRVSGAGGRRAGGGPALLGPVGLLGVYWARVSPVCPREVLLTNSFGSKGQVKFIKSTWAQRQARQADDHPVPLPDTSGQRRTVHSPPSGLPTLPAC